ncbi:MAG: VPLPA-CTERM sorting domain-containing protein [Paracoccaceae bacterium]
MRYALLDQGSLPPDPSAVPLPAGGLLLLGALGAAAFVRRRKQA